MLLSSLIPRVWLLFFFSSRRRHTRSLRDWSSDVCSSDLPDNPELAACLARLAARGPEVATSDKGGGEARPEDFLELPCRLDLQRRRRGQREWVVQVIFLCRVERRERHVRAGLVVGLDGLLAGDCHGAPIPGWLGERGEGGQRLRVLEGGCGSDVVNKGGELVARGRLAAEQSPDLHDGGEPYRAVFRVGK